MGRISGKITIAALLGIALPALGGCSHAGEVGAIATDYNRSIARARGEQVLLNVLRASAREPLQFTTFGEIAASVNRTVGIETVATNLIAGGANAISPTLSLGGSTTPIFRIAPLSSRDFTDGFLRPITPEVLHLFISQGWDGEFLLPLVVSSYTCNGRRMVNSGDGEEGRRVRETLAAAGDRFRLRQEHIEGAVITMTLSSDRAIDMLSEGVAPGHVVLGVAPGDRPGTSVVRIRQPEEILWVANATGLCGGAQDAEASFDNDDEVSIQLRSPQAIVYFLGEAFRPCYLGRRDGCELVYHKEGEIRYLFRLHGTPPPADAAAVSVDMYGTRYWVPRLDVDDTDRSLKTVAFLDQLIALQTNSGSLSTTPTLISVPPG